MLTVKWERQMVCLSLKLFEHKISTAVTKSASSHSLIFSLRTKLSCVIFSVSSLLLTRRWKSVLFGEHWNSKDVLHATSWVVTSVGCFIDNQGSKELWIYATLTRNHNNVKWGHCEPTLTLVPIVATVIQWLLFQTVAAVCSVIDSTSCRLPSS